MFIKKRKIFLQIDIEFSHQERPLNRLFNQGNNKGNSPTGL